MIVIQISGLAEFPGEVITLRPVNGPTVGIYLAEEGSDIEVCVATMGKGDEGDWELYDAATGQKLDRDRQFGDRIEAALSACVGWGL